MEATQTVSEERNLLSEIENDINQQPADKGLRFVNFLLDMIAYYGFIIVIGMGIGLYGLSSGNENIADDLFGASKVAEYIFSHAVYLVFYTLIEGISKGRSLGKWITGTVAVRMDGNTITWKDAFLRSLSRIVPFEPFSALGYAPWHDKWTETTVVKKSK
jgi:uncharacterized RDD family membrane protein YckC